MCDLLRKVTFHLIPPEFDPDMTPEEAEKMENLCKERQGYFHRWTEDIETRKDLPYVKTMALVEDLETGKIHMVEPYNLTFKDK